MAGINQGTPEVAVGEPVRLGDNGEYELEHDPVTDRLIVRDTVNNKEAYVRPETNGQIGNQGAFIRSLVTGDPLADDGRTYSSVAQAETNSNGWMFLPPGTFGPLDIDTQGLTVIGSGYGTLIDGGSSDYAIDVTDSNVTIKNLSVSTDSGGDSSIYGQEESNNLTINNVTVRFNGLAGFETNGDETIIYNCLIEDGDHGAKIRGNGSIIANCIIRDTTNYHGIQLYADDIIVANNIIRNAAQEGITLWDQFPSDCIIISNRVINSTASGIRLREGNDNIVANNRVSDSGDTDIEDNATNTLLDANLTGSAN